MTKTTLSPEQKKVLRGKHPLYSKLSGDVVWCIFEELGYSAEACERAMDDFFAAMQQTLLVMQHMEAAEASAFVLHAAPVPHVVQTVPPSAAPQLAPVDSGGPVLSAAMGASPCPSCAPLVGLRVSRANPAWPQYLPPFAVGCLCQCTVSADSILAAAPVAELPPPPSCGLVCPLLEATKDACA